MIGWLYDLGSRRLERGPLGERRRELVGKLEGHVVEIGAGTGANLPHYRRAAHVVAVEPDSGMARRLPARIAAAGVPVDVVTARAEVLPFPDASFDAAVATLVLCSVADPARALAELRRVLRPGSPLVLLEHVRGEGRVARWQERLTPLHRRVAGNCHLNRDTADAVAAAGFDTTGLERTRIPGGHPLVRAGVQGRATRISS